MSSFAGLMQSGKKIMPPAELVRSAVVPDYEACYAGAMADAVAYWDRVARTEVDWFKPYDQVLDWQYPHAKWFAGGQTNICYNALDRHADGARRNKAALIWVGEDGREQVFTYQMLRRQVARLAGGLRKLGVGRGDRVIIYMPLTPEGIMAMLACARIGAVHSVVYAGLGAGALRQRIEDAQARFVLCADVGIRRGKRVGLKSIVDEATEGNPLVEKVVVLRRVEPEIAFTNGEIDWHDLMAMGDYNTPCESMESEDWLFILYTSGSTGTPKGVAYTHGGYMVGTQHIWRMACDIKEDDVYFCTSDIGWIVGHSIMVYGPMVAGSTIVVREGAPDYPHPGVIWELVERLQVTKMYTAPTALRMFMRFGAEYPKKYDLSSLRIVNCAGEPLNPEAQLWALEHIMQGRGPVLDNWWQTETAAPTIGTLPSYPSRPGRAGKPFPGIIAEVLDREGRPVGPNQGGLLCLRGPWPHMFRTVWGAPERYEQYWQMIPGVYTAGDVATVDEDGYIMVLGRADDVLNVAGHRIGTADVESALVSHAAVGEAAVIGKPDPVKGEAIKAFVILRAGHEPSEHLSQALTSHVRHQLGAIATPSEITFVAKLPKTRSGKIMRRVLKAQELGLDPGDLTTIEE
ncbi:MAG TPA: acetate--CoA ligase [Symbiobacteriaceae bacterium]|nr:acetate--CoA ligase [Symbiobacteriaceae bacterium]